LTAKHSILDKHVAPHHIQGSFWFSLSRARRGHKHTLAPLPLTTDIIMSLSAAANAVRAAVLRHMRLGVQGQTQLFAATSAGALALAQRRGFAGGGYLDKGEVTERVLNVAKHFEKIQADKVSDGAADALVQFQAREARAPAL